MIYAKKTIDNMLAGLYAYDYTPNFYEDTTMTIITAEEYVTLLAEMRAAQPDPPQTDEISDAKALRIIMGEE